MAEQPEKEVILLRSLYDALLPHYAQVYFTILSIIQGLAIAFLLSESKNLIPFIGKGFTIEWFLRVLLALVVILIVWHRYIIEAQYILPITWFDTLIPFGMGIAEWFLVIATNPEQVSFRNFCFCLASVNFVGLSAYGYVVCKRGKRRILLYVEMYSQAPIFAKNLITFLRDFHVMSIWWLSIIIICIAILGFVSAFGMTPFRKITFPLALLFLLIVGEYAFGLRRLLHRDEKIGAYFKEH